MAGSKELPTKLHMPKSPLLLNVSRTSFHWNWKGFQKQLFKENMSKDPVGITKILEMPEGVLYTFAIDAEKFINYMIMKHTYFLIWISSGLSI